MIKSPVLSIFFLAVTMPIFSMQKPLTPEEENCFMWLDNNIGLKAAAYNALPEETRKAWMFTNEDTVSLELAMTMYVNEIYKAAEKAGIEVPFDANTLKRTILHIKKMMRNKEVTKPTDRITARMYVFSSLLTPEEQVMVFEKNYKKNPEAASEVMLKNGRLLAEELAKLNIIENTPEAKEQEAQLFWQKKMEALRQTYK